MTHLLSTHAGNPAPRWRIVFIALLLALTIGSAGQAPLVLAAPVGKDDIDFDLSVYPEKLPTICPNQKLTLYTGVSKATYKAGLVDSKGRPIPIPGKAPDPIITGKKISGVGTLEKVGGVGDGGDDLYALKGENTFVFTSDTRGTAKLKFTVTIQNSWIGAKEEVIGSSVQREKEITIKVGCKFKAKVTQQAVVAGGANFNIVAMIDEAEITGDEQGHLTGTAPVNWVGAAFDMGICFVSIDVAPTSQAEFTGDMDESGQLTLNLSYQPPESSLTATCVGITRTESLPLTAQPLEFSMPSSGGVVMLPQGLVWINTPSYGSALVVVVPVEDEAAAFNPGNLGTRIGTLFRGWAMQWDGFLSLFGALLVLR